MIIWRFVDACNSRGLKIYANNNVIELREDEGSVCEIFEYGMRMEYLSEFKYLGYLLDERGTYSSECRSKVASGKKVANTVRSLVNARSLQFESTMFWLY